MNLRYDIIWAIWAVFFVVFEGYALANHNWDMTLTRTTKRFVPRWVLWVFCSWLIYHFGVTYSQ